MYHQNNTEINETPESLTDRRGRLTVFFFSTGSLAEDTLLLSLVQKKKFEHKRRLKAEMRAKHQTAVILC